jgi:uncharacterized protein YukJ
MVGFSSIDAERIKHVNYLMDGLNNRLTELYEELADRETDQAKKVVKILIEELKTLHDSMEDAL